MTSRSLPAGKHVYSEKPLATLPAEARGLVRLAQERGLRLTCAPANLLGEAQQTALSLVREGAIGEVRTVYAEANGGRIEAWHRALHAAADTRNWASPSAAPTDDPTTGGSGVDTTGH